MINRQAFERLLSATESAKLDFKREQYQLSDDDAKSKLIKDILCMANTLRPFPGRILVGVEAREDGANHARGIGHHHDDATLQQIVSSKVAPPPRFLYSPLIYNGLRFAVIEVEPGRELHWPTKDYGVLQKDTLYTRAGSGNCEASADQEEELKRDRELTAMVHVSELLAAREPDPVLFYSGQHVGWSEMFADLDVRRTVLDGATEHVASLLTSPNPVNVVRVMAPRGFGKSTFLRRLAINLSADSPYVVLFVYALGAQDIALELLQARRRCDRPLLVCIDDAAQALQALRETLPALREEPARTTLVLAERVQEWEAATEQGRAIPFGEGRVFQLERLNCAECRDLARCLLAHRADFRHLRNDTEDTLAARLFDKCRGDLVVALCDVVRDRTLEEAADEDLRRITQMGERLTRAYVAVALFDAYGAQLPPVCLLRFLECKDLFELRQDVLAHLTEFVRPAAEGPALSPLTTGHGLKAEAVVQVALPDPETRTDFLVGLLECLDGSNPSQVGQALTLLKGVAWHRELGSMRHARRVFGAAASVISDRVPRSYLLHIWATAERYGEAHRPAMKLFREVVGLNVQPAAGWHGIALCMHALGQHEKALAYHQKGLATDASDPVHWCAYGTALWRAGRLAEAEQAFREGLARDPAHVGLHIEWGNMEKHRAITARDNGDTRRANDHYRTAVRHLKEALELDAYSGHAYSVYGGLELELGHLEEAARVWEAAIKRGLCEKERTAFIDTVNRLDEQGRYAELAAMCAAGLEVNPSNSDRRYKYSKALSMLGRHLEAAREYDRTTRSDPGFDIGFYYAGTNYHKAGRLSEARDRLEKAIEAHAKTGDLYSGMFRNDLGLVLVDSGQAEKAAEAWREGIQLGPDFPWCYFHLACYHLHKAQHDQARALFQQAIAANARQPRPDDRLEPKARDQLARIAGQERPDRCPRF